MTPERWKQISQLYHAALARDASQRTTFLTDACAGDEGLLQNVESLLAHQDAAERFMNEPALVAAAMVLGEDRGRSLAQEHIGEAASTAQLTRGVERRVPADDERGTEYTDDPLLGPADVLTESGTELTPRMEGRRLGPYLVVREIGRSARTSADIWKVYP